MSDLISRAELFNKLSTLHSEDLKYQADVYMVINSMDAVQTPDLVREVTEMPDFEDLKKVENILDVNSMFRNKNNICDEMKKLRVMLNVEKIEWRDESDDQIPFIIRTKFNYAGGEYSVIHGFCTYGGFKSFDEDRGLLELMVPCGRVYGFLTAKEVMDIVMER